MKSPITTHVLDTTAGRPAVGIEVQLSKRDAHGVWCEIGSGTTDVDGRVADLLAATLESGEYRLRFETGAYFDQLGTTVFYPYIEVAFSVAHPTEHYHVPILINPFGYSTYRGS
ncbi:MAG: hydroxyisourate hydrolase [Gemmatimonadota bacterium]